jgi:purine-nucleoside phosphorylase
MTADADADLYDRLRGSVAALGLATGGEAPVAGLVVAASLLPPIESFEEERFVPWQDVPHAPAAAPEYGLTLGALSGRPVAMAHAIGTGGEDRVAAEAAFPVRLMRMIGVPVVIVCDRAVRLADHPEPGSVALVTDHLNLTGDNALIGPNDDRLGPRFPDMTAAYSRRLNGLARSSAIVERISLHEAVLAAVNAPGSLSGGARERLRSLGADLAGTGVVHEVTAAVHMGLEVAALLAITGNGSQPGAGGTGRDDRQGAGSLLTRLVEQLIVEL